MSYVSLLKNIPGIFSQPTGIAAIASLGIHGAVALIVPLMPVQSSKPKDTETTKPVGIMELSQADQNRLPQSPDAAQQQLTTGTQFPLPPQNPAFNPGDQASALPTLPPPPNSSQLILPPIPKSLDQYSVAALPRGQSLQIVPRSNFKFDTSGLNSSRNFSPSVSSFNNRDIKLGEAKPLPVDKLPTLPGARLPEGLPNNPVTPYPGESGNTPQANQAGNNTPEVPQNEGLIAQIGKTPQAGDQLALAPESLTKWQQQPTATPPSDLPNNTTAPAIAQVNSYEDLRKAVRQEYPNVEEKAVIRDTVSTNKPELTGTVLGGAVIDPDGKVLEIKFQDKSVSPDLQLKAREYFVNNRPKGHSKVSYYPFSLEFQNSTVKNPGTTPEATSTPATTGKPLSNSVLNDKQPVATPAATAKPSANSLINDKKPTPTPTATGKPSPDALVNDKKTVTTPTPAATAKPLPNSVVNEKQPLTVPVATDKPSTAGNEGQNEPVTVVEPSNKLIQQLRNLREQKENSQPKQ